jgi:small nuclear ribonucleoprotein (snRNP)-like protein
VQKEINRDNFLEAVDNYLNLTLATLVEVLRMKYNPLHYEFKMRYIHYELPPEIVRRLEQFHCVRNAKDLQKKYDESTEWLHEIITELDKTYASSS